MSNLNNVRFRQEQVSVFNGNNCPLSAGFSVRNRRNTHLTSQPTLCNNNHLSLRQRTDIAKFVGAGFS